MGVCRNFESEHGAKFYETPTRELEDRAIPLSIYTPGLHFFFMLT